MKRKSRFRVGNKFLVFICLHTAVLTLYQLTGWFISVFQRVPWNDFLTNLFHKIFVNICTIGNNILTSEDKEEIFWVICFFSKYLLSTCYVKNSFCTWCLVTIDGNIINYIWQPAWSIVSPQPSPYSMLTAEVKSIMQWYTMTAKITQLNALILISFDHLEVFKKTNKQKIKKLAFNHSLHGKD